MEIECNNCKADFIVTGADARFCVSCGSADITKVEEAFAPSEPMEKMEAPKDDSDIGCVQHFDDDEEHGESERWSFNCGAGEDWGLRTKSGEFNFTYKVQDAPAQGTDEWLRWRSEGITATEAAVIMFPDQYKSALTVYNQKVGIAPPDDQSDPDGFFEWGHILEEDLVEKFKTLHPELAETVTQGRLYQRNWAKCSLDAQCVLPDGTPCIIECKSSQSASKWNPYPEKYFAQVQWQMYVTGIRKAIIIALICEGGYHYIEREVEYSPKFVEKMLYKCLDIYSCVQFKKVPEISVLGNPESDKKAIAQLAGESDRSGEDATITREEYEEYERLKEVADKATEAFETFKNKLAYKMLDSPRTTCEGKKFASWVERKGSIKVDAKKLKELYPEVYDAVTSEGLPSRYIKYNKLTFAD